MPLSVIVQNGITVVVNYSRSCTRRVIYALWSLCCMSVISDVWGREWKRTGDGRSEEGGDGGKKVSKLQIVWIRDACFFFSIFSNNLTYCYRAAGRLIHSSAGWQYLNSNYKADFYFFLCYLWLSPIIGSEVPQLYAKACLNCREKIHYMSVAHAQRLEY